MKEQSRKIEVQINEEERDKLPEKDFRIKIVKMIRHLENKMNLDELRSTNTDKHNS